MMKKKDLIWEIPLLIGSASIVAAALLHLKNSNLAVLGLMEWTFQVGLVLVVLYHTLPTSLQSLEDCVKIIIIKPKK